MLFCGAIGAATAADGDAILGVLHRNLADYHNQMSHSLLAAMILGAGVAALGYALTRMRLRLWLMLGMGGALSHLLIDYLTIGRGLQLLWPLTHTRWSSPLPLFYGLHWSEGLLSGSHLVTLANELPIMAALLWLTRRILAHDILNHVGER